MANLNTMAKTVKKKSSKKGRGIINTLTELVFNKRLNSLPRPINRPHFLYDLPSLPSWMRWTKPFEQIAGSGKWYRRLFDMRKSEFRDSVVDLVTNAKSAYNTYKQVSGVVGDLLETIIDPDMDILSKGQQVYNQLSDSSIPDMINDISSAANKGYDYLQGRMPASPKPKYGEHGFSMPVNPPDYKNTEHSDFQKQIHEEYRRSQLRDIPLVAEVIKKDMPRDFNNHISFLSDLFSGRRKDL